MLGRLSKILGTLLLALIPLAAIVLFMVSAPNPHFISKSYMQIDKVALRQNTNAAMLLIDEAEANIITGEAISALQLNAIYNKDLRFTADTVSAKVSIKLPIFEDLFINITALAKPTVNSLGIIELSAGDLAIHPTLINLLQPYALAKLQQHKLFPLFKLLQQRLNDIEIKPGYASINYQLTGQTITNNADSSGEAVGFYLDQISQLHASHGQRKRRTNMPELNLEVLIPALLTSANNRNTASPSDEYRAIVIALALHSADPRLLTITGWNKSYSQPAEKIAIGIHKRSDLGEHFITSAAGSLFVGTEATLLVGLYKEIQDAQYKKQFGLVDLAANYAGIAFATLLNDPAQTAWLQQNNALTQQANNLVPLPTKAEKAALNDVILLGKSGLNQQTINEIQATINGVIARSPLYNRNNPAAL